MSRKAKKIDILKADLKKCRNCAAGAIFLRESATEADFPSGKSTSPPAKSGRTRARKGVSEEGTFRFRISVLTLLVIGKRHWVQSYSLNMTLSVCSPVGIANSTAILPRPLRISDDQIGRNECAEGALSAKSPFPGSTAGKGGLRSLQIHI